MKVRQSLGLASTHKVRTDFYRHMNQRPDLSDTSYGYIIVNIWDQRIRPVRTALARDVQ